HIFAHPSGIVGVAEALEVRLVDDAEAPDVLEGVDLALAQAILRAAQADRIAPVPIRQLSVNRDCISFEPPDLDLCRQRLLDGSDARPFPVVPKGRRVTRIVALDVETPAHATRVESRSLGNAQPVGV